MKYLFLILSCLYLSALPAQVGINNPNPSQALDVGGKIKVGDDEITPVAGTIRYNRVTRTFEGFDGTEWSVFNPEPPADGGASLPGGTVLSGNVEFQPSTLSSGNIYWYDVKTNTTFDVVPAGRTLYVSYMNIDSYTYTGSYHFTFTPVNSEGSSLFAASLSVRDNNVDRTREILEPNGFLVVIPSGGVLEARRINGSGKVQIRGFLD